MARLRYVAAAMSFALFTACAGKGEPLLTAPDHPSAEYPAADLLAPGGVPLTQPANGRASADAVKLYSWIRALPSRGAHRVLSGQSFGYADVLPRQYGPMFDAIQTSTGRSVALASADYGMPSPVRGRFVDLGPVNESLTEHWKKGGLVTVSWRAPNPWTDGDATDRSMVGAFSKLTTPGNPLNVKWMRQLSQVADGLDQLRKAGVVVLWRPFNSVNGTNYWWSNRGARPGAGEFAALWKHMFDYFTTVRHLDNVLWVYSVAPKANSAIKAETYFWPGQTRVDVVSVELSHPTQGIRAWSQLKALGKPLALGEYTPTSVGAQQFDYGELMELVRAKYPEIVYFVAPVGTARMSAQASAHGLLWDSWVVNLPDVDWR